MIIYHTYLNSTINHSFTRMRKSYLSTARLRPLSKKGPPHRRSPCQSDVRLAHIAIVFAARKPTIGSETSTSLSGLCHFSLHIPTMSRNNLRSHFCAYNYHVGNTSFFSLRVKSRVTDMACRIMSFHRFAPWLTYVLGVKHRQGNNYHYPPSTQSNQLQQ